MSGASSSGRVRKKPPASGMLEVSGPRPSLEQLEVLRCECAEERRLVGLVVELRHAVVLQVVADRQVLADLDPVELEVLRRPDAREHQQHGRLVGAGREDHLALGSDLLDLAVAGDLDPDGAGALEQDPQRHRVGEHVQVRPLLGRMQEGGGGRAAAPVPLRELEAPDALLAGAVEVGVELVAREPASPRSSSSISGLMARLSDTLSGPPTPWNSSSPRSLSSERLKYGSTSS